MVFECLDCPFCRIALVSMRWQLEVYRFCMQELLQYAWCFIVRSLELRSQSSGYQGGVNGSVTAQQF